MHGNLEKDQAMKESKHGKTMILITRMLNKPTPLIQIEENQLFQLVKIVLGEHQMEKQVILHLLIQKSK